MAVLGLLTLAPALSASAETPLELDGSLTDTVGVVDDPSRAQAAIDDLASETGVGLYVVFVSDFENPSNPADWADQTAVLNDLGTDDILLAVALDDGAYWASYSSELAIGDTALRQVENEFEAVLGTGDLEAAVITAADGYRDAALAAGLDGDASAPPGDDSAPPGEDSGATTWFWILVVIALAVFIGWLVFRRRPDSAGGRAALPSVAELRSQADRMLVQLDDAVQSATQELGFAEAQFGAAAVQPMTAAVAQSKTLLQEAFALKQRLDDAFPEGEPEQRQLLAGIMERCTAAGGRLNAADADLDALRELSGNAQQAIDTATRQLAAQRTGLDAAASTVDDLRTRYGADAVATISDSVEQARTLLDDAEKGIATATQQLAASDDGQAALAVQAVQAALAQAGGLIAGVDAVRGSLADSASRLDAARASVAATIAEAEALAKAGTVPASDLEPSIARAKATLETSAAPGADPVAALAQLAAAQQQLDPLLSGARDDATTRAAAVGALEQALQAASAQLIAARQYIETRRGGVGADARSRLQSAETLLARAEKLRASDPVEALANARAAYDTAKSATELADRDVQQYRSAPQQSVGGLNGVLGGFMLGSAYGRHTTRGWGLGTGWGAAPTYSAPRPAPQRRSSGGFSGGFWGGGGSSSSRGWGGFSGGGSRRSGGRSGGFSGGGSRRSGGGGRRR